MSLMLGNLWLRSHFMNKFQSNMAGRLIMYIVDRIARLWEKIHYCFLIVGDRKNCSQTNWGTVKSILKILS